jgi:hypothetical protein
MHVLKEMKPQEIYAIDSKTGKQVKERQYYINSYYLPQAELKQLFKTVKKWEDRTPIKTGPKDLEEQLNGEIYLSVSPIDFYKSYAVTVTEEFKAWLLKRDVCGGEFHINFEFFYHPKTNSYLLSFQYEEILGGSWLKEYSAEEVKAFFPEVA